MFEENKAVVREFCKEVVASGLGKRKNPRGSRDLHDRRVRRRKEGLGGRLDRPPGKSPEASRILCQNRGVRGARSAGLEPATF
jgi:hypothetical protein